MHIVMSSLTPFPVYTSPGVTPFIPFFAQYDAMASLAKSRPLESEYASASDSDPDIIFLSFPGAWNPKTAGLPIFSLSIFSPAASMAPASSSAGPRTS